MVVKAGWLVALVLLAPALAGCADDAPTPAEEPVQRGGSTSPAPTADPPPPVVVKPKGTSERWHFHDYWKGAPTITLAELNVTLNATAMGPDGLPSLSAIVELPNGVIVPAETGHLTVNVTWDPPTTGLVNLSYRPADSNDYMPAGDLALGTPLVIPTTESMCDVPHRQQSLWRFNFTAKPEGTPPQLPMRDVHVVITATIGRPLFIDPPHLDWWLSGDVIPVVQGAKGDVATAATRAGNLTLVPPGGASSAALPAPQPVRVPVDPGRIVPEGAKSVVAFLNWTSDVPTDQKLVLAYAESNLPSAGDMAVKVDGKGSRLFVLPIQQAQTDTTYSNRTTWEFHVRPEGTEGAFRGSFTLVAWATRLSPDAAAAMVTAK